MSSHLGFFCEATLAVATPREIHVSAVTSMIPVPNQSTSQTSFIDSRFICTSKHM